MADRMHAITVLAGMAAIPPMLTAAFESNLSPKDREDWKKLRQLQPDYARTRFQLPTYRDKEGRFHYIDMTNMIPADNYTQMAKAAVAGDTAAFTAANPFVSLQDTPLLNIATEQISGEDLRSGRKISGLLERSKEVLKEILPPIVPPGYEGTRLANAFSESKDGDRGLTNIRTGVVTRPSDIVANYLTGMRFATVQLSTLQRQARSAATQQVAHEQQLLRDVTSMNRPAAEIAKAQARYNEAVTQIMLSLNEKLGVSGLNR